MKELQETPMTTLPGNAAIVGNLCANAQLPVRTQGNALRVLAACLGGIALAIHFSDYGPLIPILEHDLSITPGQAGLLSSLLWAGLIVACLPAGWLSDRYGQRPVLIGALALLLVGGVLLPLWPTLDWILACRALIGLGAGATFVASAGVVAHVETHAALVQGCYGGCVQIGSGLGLLVTPLLAIHFGWQGAFLVWGVAGVPALLCWIWVGAGQHSGQAMPDGQPGAVVAGFRSPAVWTLGISHMGTFGTSSVLAAWISVYLVHDYHVSLSLAATFGALVLIAGAAIRPLGGLLLSKRTVQATFLIRVGTIGTCLGVAVLALPLHAPALAAFGMTAVAVGATLPYAAVFDGAARLRTVRKGVAQGLVSLIAWQSLLWAPPLIGVLWQITGSFSVPFGALALVSAIPISASFLVGSMLQREQKRRQVGLVGAEGW